MSYGNDDRYDKLAWATQKRRVFSMVSLSFRSSEGSIDSSLSATLVDASFTLYNCFDARDDESRDGHYFLENLAQYGFVRTRLYISASDTVRELPDQSSSPRACWTTLSKSDLRSLLEMK